MRQIITYFLLIINYFIVAQVDSTSIKNKQLIEDLKYRINTIDNIGKGKTAVELELDAMKLLVKQQNDSILKLNALLANYAKVLNEPAIQGAKNTSLKITNSNSDLLNNVSEIATNCACNVMLYKPYQTTLKSIDIKEKLTTNSKIKIIGHADNTGDEGGNIELSKQRALELKKYIIDTLHIASKLITTEWYGSSKPCSKQDALNRRVEVYVY